VVEVRPEQVAGDAQGERPGHGVQHGGGDQDADVAVRAQPLPPDPGAGAERQTDEEGERPGRRGEGVRGDQVAAVHHVRQRRGQPGQQEPVDRQRGEDQPEQRRPAPPRVDRQRQHPDQPDPHEVRPGQHLAPRPAVEEHPDERTEHAERQQHHGECARDRGGARLPLGREHDVRRERHLEHAVGELAGDTDGEQPSKPPAAQQVREVAEGGHAVIFSRDSPALTGTPPVLFRWGCAGFPGSPGNLVTGGVTGVTGVTGG
jgi:hypothetical protein